MSTPDTPEPSSFATHRSVYTAAGWPTVLPLPPGQKDAPPTGFTGHDARLPTEDDYASWTALGPRNIAVALPDGVIGIDVDHYGDKRGGDALASLEAALGPLPPAPISTSRDDGVSGIRLFSVPTGLAWRGKAGDDIDVIQPVHRYLVVAPSLHPEGRRYRWRTDGETTDRPPHRDSLPALPPSWVEHLRADRPGENIDIDAWLGDLEDGEPTAVVEGLLHDFDAALVGGRRDVLAAVDALAAAGAGGHRGVPSAIARARATYVAHKGRSDAGRDFDRQLRGSIDRVKRLEVAPLLAPFVPDGLEVIDREERFWEARPALSTIRTFAQARSVSPWAVLGGVLTDVVATVPPTVQLPAIVGGLGTLNLFVGLVGPSGAGKGAALAVARDVLGDDVSDVAERHNVGSGEGILRAFVQTRKSKDGDGASVVDVVQHSDRARLKVDEVDTLTALSNRSGATILPMLRSAWSGESLGFLNASDERRLHVKEHGYRVTLVAGIQPARSRALLDDAGGGTPQRFLWLPAVDSRRPKRRPTAPAPLGWRRLRWVPRVLDVTPLAWETIQQARDDQLDGKANALDGHALYTRLKVAAALAVLDGHYKVSDEDWHLSGIVMDVSDRTRAECERALAHEAARSNVARGEAAGAARIAEAKVVDKASIAKTSAVIRGRLDQPNVEWLTRGELNRAVGSRHRDYLDEALDALVKAGTVLEETGQQGSRKFRAA